MAPCFIFGSKTIFQGKVRLLSALLEWVGFKFFASGVNLSKNNTFSSVVTRPRLEHESKQLRGSKGKVFTFYFYFGQLDTLVPSALKANKFSGPPAFWSPQTWVGPPHMCAVCGNFKDRAYRILDLGPTGQVCFEVDQSRSK